LKEQNYQFKLKNKKQKKKLKRKKKKSQKGFLSLQILWSLRAKDLKERKKEDELI
jgi:hypothetical protein